MRKIHPSFFLPLFFVLATIIFFACRKTTNAPEEKSQSVAALKKKTKEAKKSNPNAKYPGAWPYPCGDSRCVGYSEPSPDCGDNPPPNDVTSFTSSPEFGNFTSSNPTIASKIVYTGAQVRNDYYQLLNQTVKTVHLPVIEPNGDTSAVIIGVPDSSTGNSPYIIIYQNNQLAFRSVSGYYGEVGYDLFNSTQSYSAKVDSVFELISDTLVAGPRWINNYSSPAARAVLPTGECIDNVMDKFWERCHGGCRFMCRFSDTFGFGTCTGGQYIGAAIFCSRNNNNYAAY